MSAHAQRRIGVTIFAMSLSTAATADVILEYDTGHPVGPHFLDLGEETQIEISVTDRTGEQWGVGAVLFDFAAPDGGLTWDLNGLDDKDFTEDDDFWWHNGLGGVLDFPNGDPSYYGIVDPPQTVYLGFDCADASQVPANGTLLLATLTVRATDLGDVLLEVDEAREGILWDACTFLQLVIEDGTDRVTLTVLPPLAPTWFVDDDADGANDGSSWENAFTDLQDALDQAAPEEQIWVAAGTYNPDRDTGDRYASFELQDGVAIYGGFAGWETSIGFRAGLFDQTILSGDLHGNDGPDFENYSENSYHVVKILAVDESTILDGFTITAGNADGSDGGGLLSLGGSPTLRKCLFLRNKVYPGKGGGMFHGGGGSPVLEECRFEDNWASAGGGCYNAYGLAPIFNRCTFTNNKASLGGGLYNLGSNALLTNSIFSDNFGNGGGIFNIVNSHPTIINCTIACNRGQTGPGMHNGGNSEPVLVNCIFWGNVDIDGGSTTESAQINGGDPIVSFCCIQGLDQFTGDGNIGDDPLLTPDYHISTLSRCVDFGDDSVITEIGNQDIDGEMRMYNSRLDIGADEVVPGMGDITPPGIVHGGTDVSFDEHAFSGYIDPRDETGLDSVTLTFSEPVRDILGSTLTVDAFEVRETGAGIPPVVSDLQTSDGQVVTLTLSRALTFQEWTTIQANVEDMVGNVMETAGDLGEGQFELDRVDIGFLPCDVNQSGEVTPTDFLLLRQYFILAETPDAGVIADYIDTNRNGMVTPLDALRYRQLIFGVSPATRAWAQETMHAPQP